jgi:hypothetical protein
MFFKKSKALVLINQKQDCLNAKGRELSCAEIQIIAGGVQCPPGTSSKPLFPGRPPVCML